MPIKFFSQTLRVFATILVSILCSHHTFAQQQKGDLEILFFSSGFFIDTDPSEVVSKGSLGSLEFRSIARTQSFNIGGKLGYFITRNHELGAGTSLVVSHSKFCTRTFENGQLIESQCESGTSYGQGLSGFYRYNFSREGARGFPFAGAEIAVADVTNNFTGNVTARPFAGYKYFLKRNVALDLSVGYFVELNKVKEDNGFFSFERERGSSISGQIGLSFVF